MPRRLWTLLRLHLTLNPSFGANIRSPRFFCLSFAQVWLVKVDWWVKNAWSCLAMLTLFCHASLDTAQCTTFMALFDNIISLFDKIIWARWHALYGRVEGYRVYRQPLWYTLSSRRYVQASLVFDQVYAARIFIIQLGALGRLATSLPYTLWCLMNYSILWWIFRQSFWLTKRIVQVVSFHWLNGLLGFSFFAK